MESSVLFIIPGACSFGSIVALEWATIPYKIGITIPEIRASESFRKINPTGKVGALKDGESLIGENLAILLYLADKYPESGMCPAAATSERAKVYQWLSFLSSTLHPAFSQSLFPGNYVEASGVEQFKQLALERLVSALTLIEKSITAAGFLTGSKPNIVDAQAYGLLRWCKSFNKQLSSIDLEKFKKINQFFALMEAEPAVKNALAIEKRQVSQLIDSQFVGYYEFA